MTFVHAINGISVLAGGPQDMSSLPIATATPEDLALWQNGLQWDHEIVAANDPVLPQDAIVLNRYGQAVEEEFHNQKEPSCAKHQIAEPIH